MIKFENGKLATAESLEFAEEIMAGEEHTIRVEVYENGNLLGYRRFAYEAGFCDPERLEPFINKQVKLGRSVTLLDEGANGWYC